MAWFQVADGRLRFSGRITRDPFLEWVASADASAAVQAASADIRFAIFGRTRTAQRRVARTFHETVAVDCIRSVISGESDRYLATWTELAYAPSLPRIRLGLQRLVVIPRTMILARTLSSVTTRLLRCPTFAKLGEPFQDFLVRQILSQMDNAIRRAKPSPQHPIYACESWACVSIDREFAWIDPIWSGAEWLGHVMLFEMPAGRLQRRQRHELEAGIAQLSASLPGMSHRQRDGVVRTASAGLRPISA